MIEKLGSGSIIATGKSVRTVQLIALKSAVSLAKLGMKRRGRSPVTIAKEVTGLRTNDHDKLMAQLQEMIVENEASAQAEEKMKEADPYEEAYEGDES